MIHEMTTKSFNHHLIVPGGDVTNASCKGPVDSVAALVELHSNIITVKKYCQIYFGQVCYSVQ